MTTTLPIIPGTSSIVSPYGRDIDTRIIGAVRYMPFTGTTDSQRASVSGFIRNHTSDTAFLGTRMMVAEWDRVPRLDGFVSVLSIMKCHQQRV